MIIICSKNSATLIVGILLSMLITACGGGGGGGQTSTNTSATRISSALNNDALSFASSSIIINSSSVRSVINSSSAFNNKAMIAQIESLPSSPNLFELYATSTGIFGKDLDSWVNDRPDTIYKWQTFEGSVGWLKSTLLTSGSSYAPMDEDLPGIDIYWSGSINEVLYYSYLNRTERDSAHITKYIPRGKYTDRPIHWVITSYGDIGINSLSFGNERDSKNTHDWLVNLGSGLGSNPAVADQYTNDLYIASYDTLFKVSLSGNVSSYQFSEPISTLISSMGYIWVGSGNSIWRLKNDGTASHFVDLKLGYGVGGLSPIFCISQLDIFTSDGMVYRDVNDGPPPIPKSFLFKGDRYDLSISEGAKLSAAEIGLGNGIYCAETTNQYIYTNWYDPEDISKLSGANDPAIYDIKPKLVQIIPL